MNRKKIVLFCMSTVLIMSACVIILFIGWNSRIEYDVLYSIPEDSLHTPLNAGDIVKVSDKSWLQVTTTQLPKDSPSRDYRYHMTLHTDALNQFNLASRRIKVVISTDSDEVEEAVSSHIGLTDKSMVSISDVSID